MIYALVDANNFYVSCERAFNPGLVGKPVIVLSNNDGCIVSRSNEAKSIGIAMGKPVFKYKHLLKKHHVHVFSSNYALYADMSNRVMSILSRFTGDIEVYSIDEAFLRWDDVKPSNFLAYIRKMAKVTTMSTGIPISVGLAPTKTLAKVANVLAKKDEQSEGVMSLITQKDIERALINFPVADIWGIGHKYAIMLYKQGVFTACDFVNLPESWVRHKMTVKGLRIWYELRGKPCIPLEEVSGPKKNICTSRSFGALQTAFDPISEAISSFTATCAAKLRVQKSYCNLMVVFLQTDRFKKDTRQYRPSKFIFVPVATNSSIELCRHAITGLKEIFKPGYSYKKAGVILMGIVPEGQIQMNMFCRLTNKKHDSLMQTLDKLNKRYGSGAVRLASQGLNQAWKLKSENLSRRYTTRLDELIEAFV